MLVVVEDRDIADFLESLFDLEATGSRNILKVDAAEAACKQADGVDDLIHILASHAKRERIHIAEGLEERALALHDGHTGFRADVAEAEDCGTIRDDCNEVGTARISIREIDILGDLKARFRDAGRISDGEFLAVGDGRTGYDLDLARPLFVLVKCKLFLIHN